MATRFTLQGLLLRFIGALALVLLTYNPTPFSYFAWMREHVSMGSTGPEHWFVLVALLIGWVVFFRATWRSLGPLGVLLTAGFFGTLVWLLVDRGIVAAGSTQMLIWIALFALAGLLSVGISWSHVRRRLTGQFDTDDVET